MSHITIVDGVRLRFPGRTQDFTVGVEIGMLSTLMTVPLQQFTRRVTAQAADQAIPLAEKLGYRIEATEDGVDADGAEMVELTLRLGLALPEPQAKPRPFLSVVGGSDVDRARA